MINVNRILVIHTYPIEHNQKNNNTNARRIINCLIINITIGLTRDPRLNNKNASHTLNKSEKIDNIPTNNGSAHCCDKISINIYYIMIKNAHYTYYAYYAYTSIST
jgi:hypothetical protein